MTVATALMPIPGLIDPVPVGRAAQSRADGLIELTGLSKDAIRAALEAEGLETKQAKLRAKQLWHWIYNRGVSDFAAMTDIAKVQQPWFAEPLRHFPPRGDRSAGLVRRHPQMAVAHPRRQ